MIPEASFHDHYEKCKKVTASLQQQQNFYPFPPPNQPHYQFRPPPAYSESPPTNPPSSGQSWKCSSCNLNFDAREEFQMHLRSSEHDCALKSSLKIKDGFSGRPKPSQTFNPTGILTDQQPETALHSPSTQPRVHAASQPPQTNEEEIKSVVRSEVAKYLRQFLQIVESDIAGNSL
ncbi:hypothetical protein ACTXT7_017252 [Hymenolepis weldensis]